MMPRLAGFGIVFVSLLLAGPTGAVAGGSERAARPTVIAADMGGEVASRQSVGVSDQLAARFFVTVFVTSQRYSGNLVKEANTLDAAPETPFDETQGLEAGDFICNTHAKWGGHWGHFAAWLSTDEIDAKDRLTAGSGPFLAIDGAIIAESVSDLTDGALQAPIVLDELGLPIVHPNVLNFPKERAGSSRWYQATVWTGTSSDGTGQEGQNCQGWARYADEDASGHGAIGKVCYECLAEWTLGGSLGCNWKIRSHLYCFRVRSDPAPGSSS